MPDKLTDKEIVNCFEWVKNCNGGLVVDCIGCPLQEHYPLCEEALIDISFHEINRLQAENERLKEKISVAKVDELIESCCNDTAKEFAYKLKSLFPSDNEPYQYWEIHEGVDNLLKELVGEDK